MSKTETKSTVLLKHHLKALKLPTIHAECERIADARPRTTPIIWPFSSSSASWNCSNENASQPKGD